MLCGVVGRTVAMLIDFTVLVSFHGTEEKELSVETRERALYGRSSAASFHSCG